MKQHLTNDQCVPMIRAREEFHNRGNCNGPTLKGHTHAPGFAYHWGHLPSRYHGAVLMSDYIVYSYDTPIAWYGPEPLITLESVEAFLAGPGLDQIETFLAGEGPAPRNSFPLSEPHWQVPAVRYPRTTTVNHIGAVCAALAYEKTWREAEDRNSIPSPHWEQTEYARADYRKFDKREASTGGVNW